MAIDFLATEPHFLDHLAPLYHQIPNSSFYLSDNLLEKGHELNIKAKNLTDRTKSNLTVVSSYGDLKKARENGSRVVLSEHGAGQSYIGSDSGSYVGAADRRGVVAVLTPGIIQANKHIESYPMIPAYPVGVPKLDKYHQNLNLYNSKIDKQTIVISFHWDCKIVPETRSCFRFYKTIIKQMKEDFNIKIHGHPRGMKKFKAFADYIGVEYLETFDEVINQGWIYCCDNSSTIFEWISLDRPVILLNSHLYRRYINHGMRFWEFADIGPSVNTPKTFPDILTEFLTSNQNYQQRRTEVKNQVYFKPDGQGAKRAALALEDIYNNYQSATKKKIYTFNL